MSSFTSTAIAPVTVQQAGVKIATRQNLNFVSGATVVDDPSNNSADITITGGGTPGVVTWNRYIVADITVPNHYTLINSNPVLMATITLQGDAELILI